jgi:hypothetical protein
MGMGIAWAPPLYRMRDTLACGRGQPAPTSRPVAARCLLPDRPVAFAEATAGTGRRHVTPPSHHTHLAVGQAVVVERPRYLLRAELLPLGLRRGLLVVHLLPVLPRGLSAWLEELGRGRAGRGQLLGLGMSWRVRDDLMGPIYGTLTYYWAVP